MKVAVIDHYDSFTFNLVQAVGEHTSDLKVYLCDQVPSDDLEAFQPTHLIFSPGPGMPKNTGQSPSILKTWIGKIPILGVCLGYQLIASHYGYSLLRSPKIFHGKTSQIEHTQSGLFQGISSPTLVMRYHSWIVDGNATLGLQFTAHTKDFIPMAFEDPQNKIYGVQFHPESILTNDGKKMIKNFLWM